MNNLTSLAKRIDTLLLLIEGKQQQQAVEQEEPVFFLPIKSDEPPIPYRRGLAYFYVPDHRLHEGGSTE